MGEDTRATDARGGDQAGLRARGAAARRAPGDQGEARPTGGDIGPVELDEAQLAAWGRAIGEKVDLPVVIALRGDLGAGKSVLARAIAQGAGVDSHMPSPTFNLLFAYETPRATVNHLDLYRIEDASEVWELGWRDFGDDDQIVLIEWPERAESLLQAPRWDVRLQPSQSGPDLRIVTAARVGDAPELPAPPSAMLRQ